jgi:hypothetical protein
MLSSFEHNYKYVTNYGREKIEVIKYLIIELGKV